MAPEQQAARGVPVQPMGEPRIARQAEAQVSETLFEILAALGTSMDRQARGLVENQHHPVAVEQPRINLFRRHAGQAIERGRGFCASGDMAAYRKITGI